MTDWINLTERASFASHRLIGWIFWDPTAQAELEKLGVSGGLGHYIAYRGAPLAGAGTEAVVAAFYTIKRDLIEFSLNHAAPHASWLDIHQARDRAIHAGIKRLAPEIEVPIGKLANDLWRAVDALPVSGRVLFAAHKQWPRSDVPFVSAWNALNTLREWRGDTHFGLLIAAEVGAVEAGLLHDAWMGYPKQWIPRSRGAGDHEIELALASLERRGLVTEGVVNQAGIDFRQDLERRTNELCVPMWQEVGEATVKSLLHAVEPVSHVFIEHIDNTAGDNWMPAARLRRI